ncbi:MAG: cation:dicarboxylase symporter family transporter [Eubacteriales bacterium]|nr:cation:dicarboxylase symporter family transporter [Eubacteriales bacterium]
MSHSNEQYTYELNYPAVDEISEKLRQFLSAQKLDRREVTRHTLTAEEILLKYIDTGEQAGTVTLNMGTRFANHFITLSVEGSPTNLYRPSEEADGVLKAGLLKNLGLAPEYAYKGNENVYTFFIRKRQRINPLLSLLLVFALAFATGMLGKLLPDGVRASILTDFFDRIRAAFLNILGCLAGPMMFLSVVWGVYGIGDVATLKQIGKRLMLRYLGIVCLCVLLGGAISLSIFRPGFAGTESSGSVATVFSMILDIIPKNIFSPFVDGNTLQIIFMALIFGFAMLFLGQRTSSVAKAVEQINYIIQFIIGFISKLVPYFIFIVVVSMIWSDAADVFVSARSLILVFLLTVLVSQLLILLVTAVRNRVSPLLLLKKNMTTFIIALTTASSAAAFAYSLRTCKEEFGIDDSISSFGVPLGVVMFKPATALNYLVTAVFFAKYYSIDISASWVVSLVFCSSVLAMATPPIPGGAMTSYAVLFAQLRIPSEALAVALACYTLFDFIDTGFNQLSLPFCLLNLAAKFGLVDRDILTGKAKKKTTAGARHDI